MYPYCISLPFLVLVQSKAYNLYYSTLQMLFVSMFLFLACVVYHKASMRRLSVYQTQPRAGDSYESSLLVAAIKAGEMDLENRVI